MKHLQALVKDSERRSHDENQIAIYLRLSLEDVDKRTNAVKDDSNSIASQRLLINRHLDQTPMLCDLPRIEFCDDGFPAPILIALISSG